MFCHEGAEQGFEVGVDLLQRLPGFEHAGSGVDDGVDPLGQ